MAEAGKKDVLVLCECPSCSARSSFWLSQLPGDREEEPLDMAVCPHCETPVHQDNIVDAVIT